MMFRHTLLNIVFLFVSVVCFSRTVVLPLGPFEYDHKGLPIVLHLDDYPEFSALDREELGVWRGTQELPSQLDDLDQDGIKDELAFLVDVRAGERVKVKVRPSAHHKKQISRVFASMYLKSREPKEGYFFHEAEGKCFYITPVTEQTFEAGEDSYHLMHHHGVAFESEQMAYRIYFDKKQTVDVYAKRTPRLELDASKWYPTDAQLAAGFGDDVLRVKGRIGVGTCKPFRNGRMVHFDDVESRTQRIRACGPIRTVCEMETKGWQVTSDRKVDIITRYTLYAGHRDVEVEVFCSEPVEGLCTGVQRIGDKSVYHESYTSVAAKPTAGKITRLDGTSPGALVASWGTDWPVNDTINYSKETLGLAVFVPREYASEYTATDPDNRLIILAPSTYIKYWFTVVALKEDNPPCLSSEEFFDFVTDWTWHL